MSLVPKPHEVPAEIDWDLAMMLENHFQQQLLPRRYAPTGQMCRTCGCTDNRACPGGCYWVERNLCSRCVSPARGEAR